MPDLLAVQSPRADYHSDALVTLTPVRQATELIANIVEILQKRCAR